MLKTPLAEGVEAPAAPSGNQAVSARSRALPAPSDGGPGSAIPVSVRRRRSMSSRSPERVHVVIERTDGSRIVRLPAPRWLVPLGGGVGGVAPRPGGALYTA